MKKYLSVIIIGLIVLLYLLFYFCTIFFVDSLMIKIIFGIPMIALIFTWIYVCKERVEEIKEDEGNDLSNY